MINNLTKEQEEQIPEYIERYIRMASEPIDRSKIGGILEKIYGKKMTFFVGESIQNTIDLVKYCLSFTGKKLGKFDNQLDSQLDSQLYNQLDSQLYNQLYNQLDSQLYNQLRNQLDSQLYNQLRNQLDSQLRNQFGTNDYSYYVGVWWIAWNGWYMYGKNIGVKFDTEKLQLFDDIVRNVSNIVIFVGEVIFICEKPNVRWENKNLHSDQKMAIEWKDGTGYYYLDGVNFSEELWKKVVSKEMSFSEIMKIEISDQRTVALKYNPQAIIKENAKLLHKDNRSNELYLVENSEINKITNFPKMYFVKMTCPTGRIFIEGVDPKEAEKNPNATDMQAWLCGLTQIEYNELSLES